MLLSPAKDLRLPDKETRPASRGTGLPFTLDGELLAERRPVMPTGAAKNPLAPQPQPEDPELESVDPATEVSVAPPAAPVPSWVPEGADPLVAAVIGQLESKSLTHIPRPPSSQQPFDDTPFVKAVAVRVSHTWAEALAPREIARRLAAERTRARKAHLDVAAVNPEPTEKVSAELARAELARLMSDYDLTMDNALFGPVGRGWLKTTQSNLANARKRLTSRKRKKDPAPDPALVEAEMANERAAEALRLSDLIKKTRDNWVDAELHAVQSRIQALLVPHAPLRPQREVPEKERVPLYENAPAKFPNVAPEMRDFLDAVREGYPNISISNRPAHGGGVFKGAGFSADISLPKDKINKRGFYDEGEVLKLLKVMDGVAVVMDARWRVLYDDYFSVEKKFNLKALRGRVTAQAKAEAYRLNFHGPGELLLHLHLDVSLPPPKARAEEKPPEVAPPEATPDQAPSPPKE
jgi:hypothetical protein